MPYSSGLAGKCEVIGYEKINNCVEGACKKLDFLPKLVTEEIARPKILRKPDLDLFFKMLARCDLSKLRMLSAIKATNFRCFSASHAPAVGGHGDIEHVKVTPRFYEVLGDKAWTDKKMPVSEEFTPTTRATVEWNGKQYPYPYKGIIEEENGVEVLKMLEREYVTKDGYLRYWSLPKDKRTKWAQIWIQRENDRPLHLQFDWDEAIVRTYYFLVVLTLLLSIYYTYDLITPKNENIFKYKNWERWNAEKKH